MRKYLALALPPFALYPLAIALVITMDTGLGDAEFLRSFFLESKRATILQLATDWVTALPLCLILWALTRLSGLWWRARIVNLLLLGMSGGLLIANLSDLYLPLIFSALILSLIPLNLAYVCWLKPAGKPS